MKQGNLFGGNPAPTIRSLSLGNHLEVSTTTQKAITPATGRMEGKADFTVNPYTGCAFSCGYCYAAEFQQNTRRRENWGKWVKIKEGAARELERMSPGELTGKSVSFGTVTDPYQPIEGKTLLTRRMLQRLAENHEGVTVHIQTRSPLVPRDLDLLEQIAGRGGKASVGMSIPTDSERIRKITEPQAPGIPARLEALAKIARSESVRAIAAISPLIAIENPQEFAEKLRETGAAHYWTKPLEMRPPNRNGPPRSATRESGWPKIAEALGCPAKDVRAEYLSRYKSDSEALERAMASVMPKGDSRPDLGRLKTAASSE